MAEEFNITECLVCRRTPTHSSGWLLFGIGTGNMKRFCSLSCIVKWIDKFMKGTFVRDSIKRKFCSKCGSGIE